MVTRVLIADDHGLIRAGLRALLEEMQDIEVVGEATNGLEVLSQAAQMPIDIVLMDISMPEMGGIETTREIRGQYPEIRVLMLTVHEDEELLRESIHSGASGYIVKRAAEVELMTAMQAVLRGDIYVHPSMTRSLFKGMSPSAQPSSDGLKMLTPREIDVLRLLARGYTNRQIAEELTISIRTVEGHRGNLSAKLNLKSRVDLVNFAEENGLLDFSGS